MNPCPYCAKPVDDATTVCPSCGRQLPSSFQTSTTGSQLNQAPRGERGNDVLKFFVVGVGALLVLGVGAFLVLAGLLILGGSDTIQIPSFGPQSQAILAPDHALVTTVNRADLAKDAQVLNARAKALGVQVTFRVNEQNQIVASGPVSVLTRELIDKTIAIGLLELVDFGSEPVTEGTTVATDSGYPYFAETEGKKWHTVLTNAEFDDVQMQSGSLEGRYQVAFTLTPAGREILSDFSASHINQYLGIVMDKKVLSCPVIKNAITEGQGVIEGGFTRESAQALAAYLRVEGPLPIPLEVVDFVDGGK